jgi:hypothetical protein
MTRSVCLYVGDVTGQFEKGEIVYFVRDGESILIYKVNEVCRTVYQISDENFYNNFIKLDNLRLNKMEIIKAIKNRNPQI